MDKKEDLPFDKPPAGEEKNAPLNYAGNAAGKSAEPKGLTGGGGAGSASLTPQYNETSLVGVEVGNHMPPTPPAITNSPAREEAAPFPLPAYSQPKAASVAAVEPKGLMSAEEKELDLELKRMAMRLKIAQHFFAAGCFTQDVKNAEQAFVKIQAGAEMGMSPMRSMKGLYIVNGQVTVYGVESARRLKEHGWRLEYVDESENGVTVTISKPQEHYQYIVVKDAEHTLKNSKAMGFAPKQKMRWFGLSQLIKFYVPEVLGGYPIKEELDDIPPIEQLAEAGAIEVGKSKKEKLKAKQNEQ